MAPIGICGVAAGVEPELPGVVVPLEVDPPVDGVVPLADGVELKVLGRLVVVGTVGATTVFPKVQANSGCSLHRVLHG